MLQSTFKKSSRRTFVAESAKALGLISAGVFAGSRVGHAQTSALNEIRIGLVGCGGRGTNLSRLALKANRQNRLVAVGDLFQDRVDTAVQKLNEDGAVRDQVDLPQNRTFVGFNAYQQVLDTDVDFVFFATPAAFRPSHFAAAVEAGKHSYLEKPLGVDSPGVRQIMAANDIARQKQLSASTGLTHRHSDRYSQMISRLQQDAIGKIQSLELDSQAGPWRVRTPESRAKELEYQIRNFPQFVWLSGGPMLEFMIHSIDILNWVMKSHPVRATGRGDVNDQKGAERGDGLGSFSTQFIYSDGTELKSDFSYTAGRKRRVQMVHGDGGKADLAGGRIFNGANSVDWEYGKRKDDFNGAQINNIFSGLRRGDVINEVDSGCDSTWTTIMGRRAAYLGREVTWQETVESDVALAPADFVSLDQQAPINPDKFGDYATAASQFSA